ncbi:MAG: lysine exporter LysO family protein [Bacteroidales bacterium]|nr:lysine exporter LysO family protein [Bacteroidales bacterium]MBN2748522.1 lysine exporter LysO family protein [Bacteroidales bacterium]
MRGSLIILAFFAAGVLLGYGGLLPQWLTGSDYSSYALYLLMFLVGVGIGGDEKALKALRGFSFHILLVPLTTIVGTLIGVAAVYLFLNQITLTDVLAVGSGFGYYSLSSIIITDLRSPELGVVALLANVMREIITLLMAPLFVRFFGKLAPISSGGATSMDTTLPIISASSGKEYAIVSLFHGIVLTILVPFLVTFILSLG